MADKVRKVKTIEDIQCTGKKVFVRVDFNVPLNDHGEVADDSRIVAALPTIKFLVEKSAKVILASHLGRPKGEKNEKYSLKNVAATLEKLLGHNVKFLPDCIGEDVKNYVDGMSDGDVVLLENLRFYKEETENDPDFSKKLASLADIYVNDAFGTAHRAHASTEGITKFVDQKVAGFLMAKELEFLGDKVANAESPFVVILGGAKVSDKINVINNLLDKADIMLIGGAMSYTFLAAIGNKVGSSLVEADKFSVATDAIKKAKELGVKLMLPIDHVVTSNFDKEKMVVGNVRTVDLDIPDGEVGIDIGPKTVELYRKEISKAKTILWNGPIGVFEIKQASAGTFSVAEAIAKSGAMSIIGGGDSSKAIKDSGFTDDVSFISTGGGASLEFLEGTPLPGVEALDKLD